MVQTAIAMAKHKKNGIIAGSGCGILAVLRKDKKKVRRSLLL
jgi:hypothetical protein